MQAEVTDILSGRRRWLAFAAAVAAAAMDLLDSTIAQVAAPSIQRDLGGSNALIEWVTAVYGLSMAVGLLTGGRLGDLYGRKRVLLLGLVAFLAASVACALATNPAELIAARALQGGAGAMMVPQVFGLISTLFAPHEMGKAFGVYGPVMGLSAMLGPIVSGGLIDLNVLGTGWRAIFLVNLPVGAFALTTGARLLPDGPRQKSNGGPDLGGLLLAAAGMFLLVFPLAEGRQLHWPVWLIGMLLAAPVVLSVFGAYQRRRTQSGRTPLVEPSIFTRRSYTSGLAFSLIFCGSMGGIVLLFNVLLQIGLGYTPWHSALTTAPWALGAFFGSAIGGTQMAKHGRKILHAGLIVEAVGLVAIWIVLEAAGTATSTVDLLAPMILGGIGMGMVFVPLFDIALAGALPHELGSASSVLQSINGLGMSLGVAGLGTSFFAIAGHGAASGFVTASKWTALASIALLALAFAIAFQMPPRAREHATTIATDTPALEPLAVY